MNPFVSILTGLFSGGNNPISTLIDRLIPDKNAAEKAKQELQEKMLEWAQQQDSAQIEVNKEEAKSSSIWVAGWRPGVGWTCAAGLAWACIIQPFIVSGLMIWAKWPHFEVKDLPSADMATLSPILIGMLGLGGLRTYEKINGVARDDLSQKNLTTTNGK